MARRDAELLAVKTRIDALVLELAHFKRMRFGARSEALGADTKDLFQESIEADIAAAKLELEKRQAEAGEPAKSARSPVLAGVGMMAHAPLMSSTVSR